MNDGPALATAPVLAGPFLVSRLRVLEGRLREVAPRLVQSPTDGEAVHDLRVALRRTRTVLEVGRPILGPFYADEVRRALRSLMQATGALRDDEVLLDRMASLGATHPDVEGWLETRRRREHRLRNAVVRLVRSGDLDRGRALLAALLAFRVNPRRDRRLAKFARRAVDRARREVERRQGARPDDSGSLHRLRIAYKRLRYTAETFAEALPADLAALAQPAARSQGRLGDLLDVDVAVGCVVRARTLSDVARSDLLTALRRERLLRLAAYSRELGQAPATPLVQAVGTDSLRKISTR